MLYPCLFVSYLAYSLEAREITKQAWTMCFACWRPKFNPWHCMWSSWLLPGVIPEHCVWIPHNRCLNLSNEFYFQKEYLGLFSCLIQSCFGTTSGYAQGLLLVLHLGITSRRLQGHYLPPGLESRSAACMASALLAGLSLRLCLRPFIYLVFHFVLKSSVWNIKKMS